jgi:hypothetical protein
MDLSNNFWTQLVVMEVATLEAVVVPLELALRNHQVQVASLVVNVAVENAQDVLVLKHAIKN